MASGLAGLPSTILTKFNLNALGNFSCRRSISFSKDTSLALTGLSKEGQKFPPPTVSSSLTASPLKKTNLDYWNRAMSFSLTDLILSRLLKSQFSAFLKEINTLIQGSKLQPPAFWIKFKFLGLLLLLNLPLALLSPPNSGTALHHTVTHLPLKASGQPPSQALVIITVATLQAPFPIN